MNFVAKLKTNSQAMIFSDYEYTGEQFVFERGEYSISNIKSVKIADFTQLMLYENADGSGQCLLIDADCDRVEPAFAVQLIQVETYAKIIKGNSIDKLTEGEYTIAEIRDYEKMIVPRGFYAVFVGHKADEHAVRIFENQEVAIDSKMADYQKVLLFTMGSSDIRINFGTKEELSDDELVAVAGGKSCRTVAQSCTCFCGVATEALER